MQENRSFRYLKELLIKLLRIDTPYGCISLFIKHYMKMTAGLPFSAIYPFDGVTGWYVKEVPFLNKRYIKGLPFLPKRYIKR